MGAAMTPKSLFGYDIISEIGQGAASRIYAVTDQKSGQVYALKHVVRKVEKEQRYIEQVQNEFETSRAVSHPVLRKVYDLKTVKKFFGPIVEVALIMELIDGVPYDERPLSSVKSVLDGFMKVADALWEVNKAGYVHCDTKPGNILITSSNEIRLIDLGQACKIGATKERVQGTPSFIAPEQARCKPLTEQTDVYNFGATLYWALTGRRVPTLLTVEKSERRIIKEQDFPTPMQLNEQISPSLSELVMHCVRLRPYERVNGMGSVLMRMEDCRAMLIER
jgi:serine/threonine-protein kinase